MTTTCSPFHRALILLLTATLLGADCEASGILSDSPSARFVPDDDDSADDDDTTGDDDDTTGDDDDTTGDDDDTTGDDDDTVDLDGDGFSADADCDDEDPDVFPGQIVFFTSPRADGSYDYDCDGSEELAWTANSSYPQQQNVSGCWPTVGGYTVGWYCPYPGWGGNPGCPAPPACGSSADWLMEGDPSWLPQGCEGVGTGVGVLTQACR